MPSFVMNTNVATADIPENFNEDLTKFIQEMLNKPLKFIAIHVSGDHHMTFAGTREPCALATLSSIGKIGLEENKSYSQQLMEFIGTRLNIQTDRMYISFAPMQGENVGWNGKTFAK